MTTAVATLSAAQHEFVRRASELGVATWCFDADLNLFAGVVPHGAADAARACRDARQPISRSTDGRWLTAAFDQMIVVADVAGEHGRFVPVLTQYHADILRAEQDATTIDGFNHQLSQAYEEVNLIYRMAKVLTSTADPRDVVQTMCDELRDTLQYGWLAMAFNASAGVLPPLRQAVLHAGALPGDAATFGADCHAIDPAVTGKVLLPATHPLAARSGTEVLREPVSIGDAPIGMLVAGDRRGDDIDVSSHELQLVGAAANFLGLFHENARRFAEQRQQFVGTLHALSAAVDAKDPYTQGHSKRVGWLGSKLALALGWTAADAEQVRIAGLLHDIGKIGVPEAVLRKPAKLDDAEFALIKKHPQIGYEMLRNLPSLAFHLPGVLSHHERWDGRGYPGRLAGEAIPVLGRILAFADTFDAMSSSRAYRKGLERSHVLAEIRKSGGTQFDPAMAEAFVSLDFSEFDQMLAEQVEQQAAA